MWKLKVYSVGYISPQKASETTYLVTWQSVIHLVLNNCESEAQVSGDEKMIRVNNLRIRNVACEHCP